jgi:hypothetical protein
MPDLAPTRPRNAEEALQLKIVEMMEKRHRNRKKPPNAWRGRNW